MVGVGSKADRQGMGVLMSDEMRTTIAAQGDTLNALAIEVATLKEKAANQSVLIAELEKCKAERAELQPVTWTLRTMGAAILVALAGGFLKVVME